MVCTENHICLFILLEIALKFLYNISFCELVFFKHEQQMLRYAVDEIFAIKLFEILTLIFFVDQLVCWVLVRIPETLISCKFIQPCVVKQPPSPV